ncbi:MAG TPA: ABC transporter permease subunit [Azospirillum sp.]|nr:ABC transporter permease subunit [Azospirillum sp.]
MQTHFDTATDSPWRIARRRFAAHRPATHGLALLMVVVVGDILAPQLEELFTDGPVTQALRAGHATLAFAAVAALAGALTGTLWGVLAAGLGRQVGRALARAAGWLAALPLALLPLVVAGLAGRAPLLFDMAVTASVVPGVAVAVHAIARDAARHEFQAAAEAAGLSRRAILWRHTVPGALGPLLAALWPALPRAMAVESMASLLGLGSSQTWGALIGTAGSGFTLLPAAVLLAATLAALHAVGAGLADAFAGDRP